jgi:uncharacterized membrane protein
LPELSSAKTLGGIGSILILLTLVPWAGVVLSIVGWIMILIALKYVSDIVNDGSIFSNAIISVILSIIGLIVGFLVVIGSVYRFMGLNGYTFGSGATSTTPPTDVGGLIVGILVGLAVLWIFGLVSSIFLRMSLNKVSRALNVNMFSTAALLYLIGAALTIILVGFILLFVAEILLVVAFFSIPDRLPQAPPMQPSSMGYPPPSPTTQSPTTS